MTFSDKTRVKSRNPCYFLLKKIRVKPGTVLIETVLSGDPRTVIFPNFKAIPPKSCKASLELNESEIATEMME